MKSNIIKQPKISKYMDIKRIEFIVTWQCGGKCKHCQIGDDINKHGSHRHVLPEYAAQAVRKLSSAYNITSIMTFGGEPLYYPETTATIHKTATECGIKTRQIITNGYFTNNPEKSKTVANNLAAAGVNNLLLSVDAFHQEKIPLEPVYQFAQDIINAKIPGFRLHPAWLVDEEHQSPYNTITKEILRKFSDLSIPVSSGNNIWLGGSATSFLQDYYKEIKLDLSTGCGFAPHTGHLTEITCISIIPNGNVMVCGFAIGNIYKEDITDIIARYNPYENKAMLAIINGGVSELQAYAKTQGIKVNTSDYCDACSLCEAIAKKLNSQS